MSQPVRTLTLLGGCALVGFIIVGNAENLQAARGFPLLLVSAVLAVLLATTVLAGRRRVATERETAQQGDANLLLGRALATATSWDGVSTVLGNQLPRALGTDEAWVVLRIDSEWRALVGGARDEPFGVSPPMASIADHLLEHDAEPFDERAGEVVDNRLCFWLPIGDSRGVISVPKRATEAQPDLPQRLAAVAPLIALAAHKVQLLTQIEDHDVHDGLTGCFNRSYGMKVLNVELQRAKRSGRALTVVMFDLDYFKAVNDTHGHLCGDALLTAIGRLLQESLRKSDVKCRYGGEEFLILLPETPLEGGICVAHKLLEAVQHLSLSWRGSAVSTTASLGVAVADDGMLDATVIISRADAALYGAKRSGRNTVCVDGVDDEATSATTPQAAPDPASAGVMTAAGDR